jgi:hypothetical protein
MKEIQEKEELITPTVSVNVSIPQQEKNEVIKPEQLVEYYNEVFDDIREDRKEIDDIKNTFLEMVINDGDSSSASKEAVVNLMKMKTDLADKKTKALDLLTRIFLKEKDTFPRYLANNVNQYNNITSDKRKLLTSIIEEEKQKEK